MPDMQIRNLAVAGPRDVWITGEGGLRHYDGSGWHDQGTYFMSAFAIEGPGDIWAVASPQPNGIGFDLFHWDGIAWTPQQERFLPFSLTAAGNGELWGAAGSVMHRRAR